MGRCARRNVHSASIARPSSSAIRRSIRRRRALGGADRRHHVEVVAGDLQDRRLESATAEVVERTRFRARPRPKPKASAAANGSFTIRITSSPASLPAWSKAARSRSLNPAGTLSTALTTGLPAQDCAASRSDVNRCERSSGSGQARPRNSTVASLRRASFNRVAGTVFSGSMSSCARARAPTRNCPLSSSAITDGMLKLRPSGDSGTSLASPSTKIAARQFEVPKSIPRTNSSDVANLFATAGGWRASSGIWRRRRPGSVISGSSWSAGGTGFGGTGSAGSGDSGGASAASARSGRVGATNSRVGVRTRSRSSWRELRRATRDPPAPCSPRRGG